MRIFGILYLLGDLGNFTFTQEKTRAAYRHRSLDTEFFGYRLADHPAPDSGDEMNHLGSAFFGLCMTERGLAAKYSSGCIQPTFCARFIATHH